MIDTTTLYILAGVFAFCALLSGALALGRGRDGAIWFLLGVVFGPFAVLALLIFGNQDV